MITAIEDVLQKFTCKPIQGCPGRYIIKGIPPGTPLSELVGTDTEIQRFDATRARDPVLVVPLTGGGIISYQKKNGTLIHTLNTLEGFKRKLADLKILLPG